MTTKLTILDYFGCDAKLPYLSYYFQLFLKVTTEIPGWIAVGWRQIWVADELVLSFTYGHHKI